MHDLTIRTHLKSAYFSLSSQPAILPLLGLLAVIAETHTPQTPIHRAFQSLVQQYIYALEHNKSGFAALQSSLVRRIGTELDEIHTSWWVISYADGYASISETHHWDLRAFDAPDADAALETAAILYNLNVNEIEIE